MNYFSNNPSSSKDLKDQYKAYLSKNRNKFSKTQQIIQESALISAEISENQLNNIFEIQSEEIQNCIFESSVYQGKAIEEMSMNVCSILEESRIQQREIGGEIIELLESVNDNLDYLATTLNHVLNLIVEEQKITNYYLGNINNLIRIPDSQKQRVYHINEGLKFLKNAFKESANSKFYDDALEEFKKSIEIENKDFFSLFYIGFIHLNSITHLQPKLAESYFKKSSRYYFAEASVGGTNTSNNLLNIRKPYILGAAQASLYAAQAAYLQSKFSEAIKLASNANKLMPSMQKAKYFIAKYLAANNEIDKSVKVLEEVINRNRYYILNIPSDRDLCLKPQIQNLIRKLKKEAFIKANSLYNICNDNIIQKSTAANELIQIYTLLKYGSYLESKNANDLLLKEKEWHLPLGAIINSDGKIAPKICSQKFYGNICSFIVFERQRVEGIPKAQEIIRLLKIKNKEDSERKKTELKIKILQEEKNELSLEKEILTEEGFKGSILGPLIGFTPFVVWAWLLNIWDSLGQNYGVGMKGFLNLLGAAIFLVGAIALVVVFFLIFSSIYDEIIKKISNKKRLKIIEIKISQIDLEINKIRK